MVGGESNWRYSSRRGRKLAHRVDIPYLRDPAWRGVPDYMSGIVSDAPLAHFRRTLGKLIEAEQNAARAPAIAARWKLRAGPPPAAIFTAPGPSQA